MGKKHNKSLTVRKKFRVVDNLDTPEKRLEDRLFLLQLAMDEYDEFLGGTLDRSVSWYLMCSWHGLSSMQSAILIARLATLLDASQTGHKWAPYVHAHQGKHGLKIYGKKQKSKREKGPAFDIKHIRMVMRSVMTKEKLASFTDEQVLRFARTLQDIAAREEEREAKADRKDGPDSPGAVAFEDAKEYADPDALDDVNDVDDGGDIDDNIGGDNDYDIDDHTEVGIDIDAVADEEADSEAPDDDEDVGVLGETGPLNESATAEGLSGSDAVAETESDIETDGATNAVDATDDIDTMEVMGATDVTGSTHSADSSEDWNGNNRNAASRDSDDPFADVPPELKRLNLGKNR
ncbi:hypothetical protein OZX72_01375 [Bifidobacterium sp. ESL0769]|uniref:hypothetical protein n=1 Tax=Bifidobacterium sp. ESL0769 TaxID=2983229 RepID=UPI0023F7BFD9|nr:hypothetical protein [Bifidobacterium sp. ESL0769]WEV67680.1 hypothetical protein OZX72_01375 [Bifidobacterium sp. ESL0769]